MTVVDLSTRKPVPEAPAGVPPYVRIDPGDAVDDVVDVLFLDAFIRGDQPFARHVELSRPKPEAPLRPRSAHLEREFVDKHWSTRLYTGPGYTLRVKRWKDGSADLDLTAESRDLVDAVMDQCTLNASRPAPPDTSVKVGFWHGRGDRFIRKERLIGAEPWDAVRRNYSAAAAAALDRLMALTPADLTGRLLLLYGPPGTGKTTVLRTLATQWRAWCQLDCVLDPDRLFSEPGYLIEATLGDEPAKGRWRLLLLEDCDELIGAGARDVSGQAMSRLLNLTDGMLGQGRDVLVAITTNEDISRLHPAVTRPGRCLARIELGRLPQRQAAEWLATAERPGTAERPDAAERPGTAERGGAGHRVGPSGATLAELYAMRDGKAPVAAEVEAPVAGMYL